MKFKGAQFIINSDTAVQKFFVVFWALAIVSLVGCVNDDKLRRGSIISPAGIFDTELEDPEPESSGLSRPDKQVTIIPETVCVCRGTERVSYNDCSNFCSQFGNAQDDNTPVLFMRFSVGPDIELNPGLKDARGWCTQPIIDPNTGEQIGDGNPGCILQAKNQDNMSSDEPINPGDFLEGNFLRKPITLSADRNWRLSLLETSSGATTKNTVQVRIEQTPIDEILDGQPLKFTGVNQYSCLNRGFSTEDGSSIIFYDYAYELNYYYTEKFRPSPIPDTEPGIVCHDTNISQKDRADIPRLRLREGIFSVWSVTDPRFYDNDGINGIDIHEIIGNRVRELGNDLNENPEIFFLFDWPNMPQVSDGAPVTNSPPVGYVMNPWIDRRDFKSYCPGNYEYNFSDNPIFRVLKELIGFETEGLYLGVREPFTVQTAEGPVKAADNSVLIREALLKEIWFYVQNGQKFTPNEDTVADKTVHFYWPPSLDNPKTKKSDQTLYTVRYPAELQGGPGAGVDTGSNPYPPHDKKFACIPKTSAGIDF